MSTIHNFNAELNTIGAALASGDEFLVYDTSAGLSRRVPTSSITGGGAFLSARDTTATSTTTGQSSFTHVITISGVTVGDVVVGSLENGSNTTGIGTIRSLTAGAGIITAIIANAATTATNPFGGTLLVNYILRKGT